VNPFNADQVQVVSTSKTRVVVFWSKNPKPLIRGLDELDRRGIHYYFQFTVNDYDQEGYEPHVPRLKARLDTFQRLADRIGPERVIWRMDPLLLTNQVGIPELLEKAERIAAKLNGYTRKLVFSYADVNAYAAVRRNMEKAGASVREFTQDEMNSVAQGLVDMNKEYGFELATCAELVDQTNLGVAHNRCIDDELMIRLWPDDPALMAFLGYEGKSLFGDAKRPSLKDKGQRKECGCIVSKDIGRYGTCPHLCVYCYANNSPAIVKKSYVIHSKDNEALC
jgi:DNA repair photolyase